ncbi:aldo-keto reductase family 1 member B1-like isoform X2 [Homalodisca vitripennis]|uniref:aldo-keto reductase family 1 member B1-like isoform X2 n=1 Tax=Homalodisca vitripennis TaxID=197043 RepID=UPI001EE9B49A|nr:aldo-keto reductase family 1 member B1-like isoform X2 [Homalodisca vitripennis]
MPPDIPTIKLNNGISIPALGLGTYKLKHMTEEIVGAAIDAGYRLIDTSPVYNDNEVAVGRAVRDRIRKKVIKREDLIVVSKLWNSHHSEGEVLKACEKSLRYLSINYIDLYLINWPFGVKTKTKDNFKHQEFNEFDTTTLEDVWRQMETCVSRGLVRSIGVSNFNSNQLQRILDIANIKPVVNQIECSVRLPQTQLIQFCKERDVAVMGYRPLGAPGRAIELTPEERRQVVLENHRLTSIGERYNKTVAQVCLRYTVQLGVIPIVKTAEEERLQENMNVFNFNLDIQDIEYIQTLHNDFRTMTYNSGSC